MAENNNHKIAILSDTHGLLRPEVKVVLRTCEVILHAGDFCSRSVLEELKEIAPVYAVRGNNDKEWAPCLDRELDLVLFGVRIYMVHDRQYKKKDLSGTDLFVYGHSHKYEQKIIDDVCYLNPGSCGPRRFLLPVTMAVMEMDREHKNWQIHKVNLTSKGGREEAGVSCQITEKDLKSTVEAIIRKMQAGCTVEQIAQKLNVCCDFVEQVCRIYVTHPNVDAQGIMDKMEVSALFERERISRNKSDKL